ncbi:MAG TPA: ABC transporter permease [Ignavibacteriaceae bacterium]
MGFESFISKRYLVSKHKVNFITIISLISIVGITIGVAALIVVLSVFNGFGSLVTSFLISFDPHIRITSTTPAESIDVNKMKLLLSEFHDVKGVSPFVSGKVLAYSAGLNQVVSLKGIDGLSGNNVYDIKPNIILGDYSFSDEEGTSKVIMGLRLADKLQTIIGDTITLISPSNIEKAITHYSLPSMQKFIVAGIYSSNNNEYDGQFIFCSLEASQKLFNYKNRIQGIDVRLSSLNSSFDIQEKLKAKLNGKNYAVNTWYDFHKELYTVMQIERWTAYLILSLIVAVACFNILGSLSMSVIEKKRDVGILRAMGITEKSILKIFMYEGLLIGIVGTLLGSIIGYLVCFLQLQYKIYPLDPMQYKIDALPIEIRITDFFFIAGVAMLLSFLASLYPAQRAAKVNILDAIKWE